MIITLPNWVYLKIFLIENDRLVGSTCNITFVLASTFQPFKILLVWYLVGS